MPGAQRVLRGLLIAAVVSLTAWLALQLVVGQVFTVTAASLQHHMFSACSLRAASNHCWCTARAEIVRVRASHAHEREDGFSCSCGQTANRGHLVEAYSKKNAGGQHRELPTC